MKLATRLRPFPAFVGLAAAFVWVSSRALPTVVAVHFEPSGRATGFMRRETYVWFELMLIVVLPMLLVYVPNGFIVRARDWINLPNRRYWLAPERRAETIQFLCRATTRFGYLMLGFLAYIHWLVLQANSLVPPRLDSLWFLVGLAVTLVATFCFVWAVFRRFGRLPR